MGGGSSCLLVLFIAELSPKEVLIGTLILGVWRQRDLLPCIPHLCHPNNRQTTLRSHAITTETSLHWFGQRSPILLMAPSTPERVCMKISRGNLREYGHRGPIHYSQIDTTKMSQHYYEQRHQNESALMLAAVSPFCCFTHPRVQSPPPPPPPPSMCVNSLWNVNFHPQDLSEVRYVADEALHL